MFQISPGVGYIVAALIAGIVAFISLIISKEQKISDFRQTWIDELRKDVSDYIGYIEKNATQLLIIKDRISHSTGRAAVFDELAKNIGADGHMVASLHARIILRLNPNEHNDIIDMINRTEAYYSEKVNDENYYEELTRNNVELRDKVQNMLQGEWRRVKRGEPWFYWTKTAFLILIVVSIAAIIIILSTSTKYTTPKAPGNIGAADNNKASMNTKK